MKALFFLSLLSLVILGGCSFVTTSLPEKNLAERLEAFPVLSSDQLSSPVAIRWNSYAIPFIEAENDPDGFFALGAVHAHLRLGQMEILKRIAQGRLSEMAGPLTQDIDHTLRIIGIGRASPELYKNLDPETKQLLDSFVAGINWYRENTELRPPEFSLLQFKDEKWTAEDVLTISRLGGVDLSWIFYLGFLRIEEPELREEMWERFLKEREGSPVSFVSSELIRDEPVDLLSGLLSGNSRSGSNSIVIDGDKSGSGSALIASDPHLGISVPNFWVVAGLKSETFHVTGFMIPGLPFFALGRNPEIAWGGTNLRGLSSHLYKLGKQELASSEVFQEEIGTRWWFDSEREVRISEFGPVLSDSPFLEHIDEPLAISWVGHSSDTSELYSFLAANRATSFSEFRDAFKDYGVSAQNFLYADKNGSVGQVLAYRQPVLQDPEETLKLLKDTNNPIVDYYGPTELPFVEDPESGYIASANNKPAASKIPLALSYANGDRINRLKDFAQNNSDVTVEDLMKLQLDVYSNSSVETRDALLPFIKESDIEGFDSRTRSLYEGFRDWDGRFRPESRKALAYHLVLSTFIPELFEELYPDETLRKMLLRGSYWLSTLKEWLELPQAKELIRGKLVSAFEEASSPFFRYNAWGDLHRQKVQHPLGRIPLLGYRFRFGEFSAPGGNDTLLKSGHGFSTEKHSVTYGAQARHISDLSDIDENYFVLLGGQDGWLKSENLTDQVSLWRKGEYIKVPLSEEGRREAFPVEIKLSPAGE